MAHNMKKLFVILSIILLSSSTAYASTLGPQQGGTGLGTFPSYGQLLVGNNSNGYTLTSTTTLGISSASSTLLGDVNAFSNQNSFLGWNVGTTTAVVCKDSRSCNYTSIQSALTAIGQGAHLFVKNGVYSEQITFTAAKQIIEFESLNAKLQCNGATQDPCISTNGQNEWRIFGGTIQETNASLRGTALNFSDSAKGWWDGSRINNFATTTYAHDTISNTFYNKFSNLDMVEPLSCIDLGGTQANENLFTNIQKCRPMAVIGGNAIYVSDARGIDFINVGVEGTTTTKGNVGWYFDATSRDNRAISTWTEGVGTGVMVDAGANNIFFDGGSITSNGTDIVDNGTYTSFWGVNRTGQKLFTVPFITATSSTATSTFVGNLQIGTTSGSNRLKIVAEKDYPSSISVGGLVNINNTLNSGSALTLYDGHGSGKTARTLVVYGDDANYDQELATFQSISSTRTTIGVTGSSTAQGVIKITHSGIGTDSNASALSIDLAGSGTAAQGIFVDATGGGTTGKLLNLRNNGSELLTLSASGNLGLSTSSPTQKLVVVGTAQASNFNATSSATSTFAGGIDAARFCITGSTTCLGSSGVSSITVTSTTTQSSFATATIALSPTAIHGKLTIMASTTSNDALRLVFGNDMSFTYCSVGVGITNDGASPAKQANCTASSVSFDAYTNVAMKVVTVDFMNPSTGFKGGTYNYFSMNSDYSGRTQSSGGFMMASSTRASSIQIGTVGGAKIATSSTFILEED